MSLQQALDEFQQAKEKKAANGYAAKGQFHPGMEWENETDRFIMISEIKRGHRRLRDLYKARSDISADNKNNYSKGVCSAEIYFAIVEGAVDKIPEVNKKLLPKYAKRMIDKVKHIEAGGHPDDCVTKHYNKPPRQMDPLDAGRFLYSHLEKEITTALKAKLKSGELSIDEDLQCRVKLAHALRAAYPEIEPAEEG